MKTRTRIAALATALLPTLGLLQACSEPAARTQLPDLTLPSFHDGEEAVNLADLKGPMVINVWATWCTYCLKEMPILEEYHQANPEVEVLGIDYSDPNRDKAQKMWEKTGATYRSLRDDDGVINGEAPFPRVPGLPLWLVVDENGDVVHTEFVEMHSTDQIEAMVAKGLGKVPGSASTGAAR